MLRQGAGPRESFVELDPWLNMRPRSSGFPSQSFFEHIQVNVNNRRNVKRNQLGEQQTSDHSKAEGAP